MPKPSKVMQLDVQMISSASELDGNVSLVHPHLRKVLLSESRLPCTVFVWLAI
jgi:hypothetical protein